MLEAAGALAVLSAMITPAVLISACGTLILSTSPRLSRVVDRVRDLSNGLEALLRQPEREFAEERRAEMESQLLLQSRRAAPAAVPEQLLRGPGVPWA